MDIKSAMTYPQNPQIIEIVDTKSAAAYPQKRLKGIICALFIVSLLLVLMICAAFYRGHKPVNFIAPVPEDSIEMQTANLLAGPDGAHIYKFTAADDFLRLNVYFSEYIAGELANRDRMGLGFEDVGSPENGEIIIVPDYDRAVIKLVISTDEGSKFTTELPIMEDVPDREYYGRSQSRIEGEAKILYDNEQPLVGMIYDNDEMHPADIYDILSGKSDAMSENDFIYPFS